MRNFRQMLVLLHASPNTVLGLVAALLTWGSGGQVQIKGGCLEAAGGFANWMLKNLPPGSASGGMAAMTLGHVILGRSIQSLDSSRDHERIHVRQYEILGVFFLPVYLTFSAILLLAGKHPYLDNPLELEAYNKDLQRGQAG